MRDLVLFSLVIVFAGAVNAAQTKISVPKTQTSGALNNTLKTEISKPANTKNSSISENVYIPGNGQSALSVSTTNLYRDNNYKETVNGKTSKNFETTSGLLLKTRYDRGLSNNWAFNVESSVPMGTVEVSRRHQRSGKLVGMSDIVFGMVKASEKPGFRQLFYGGNLSISPQDRIWATEREDGNLNSGGTALSGHLGMQKDFSSHILGAKVRHDIFMDRSESFKSTSGTKVSVNRSNGNIFGIEGFVERPRNTMTIGGKVGLDFVQATDLQLSVNGRRHNFVTDSHSVLNAGVYGRIPFKQLQGAEVLPSISYSKVLDNSGGTYSLQDTTESSQISLTGRLAL